MKTFLYLTGFLITISINAQVSNWYGSKSMSLCNATITEKDVWAHFNNPSATSDLKKINLGIAYNNQYLIQETQNQALAIGIPIKKGVFSLGAANFGNKNYQNIKIGFGYALNLSENFSFGLQMNGQGTLLGSNYGNNYTASASLGFISKISENWSFGGKIDNLTNSSFSKRTNEKYPLLFSIGSSYQINKLVKYQIQVSKTVVLKPRIENGLSYLIGKRFELRGGFATNPITASFGFGYRYRFFHLDFGCLYHQKLGWSPNVSFTFSPISE